MNINSVEYLIGAKPDKLMDEFFSLNKQLQEQRNPNLCKVSFFQNFNHQNKTSFFF